MKFLSFSQTKILGSSLALPANGLGGSRATSYLVAHFALQNTKFGSEKGKVQNPARIPPQTPPAGGNSAEAKRKIIFPRKKDFRFAESVLKPHALPEYLEGRTPKEKHPFLFQKKFHPRQIRNARSVFPSGLPRLCEAVAERFILAQKKFEQMI